MFGVDGIAELVSTAVDKIWPDANIEAKAKADALKRRLSADIQSRLAQLEINKVEAASSSLFVAGWRPSVGWICSLGFGYQFLFRPVLNGLCTAFFGISPFSPIAVQDLLGLLGGLLGMGTLRTVEKVKKVAREK